MPPAQYVCLTLGLQFLKLLIDLLELLWLYGALTLLPSFIDNGLLRGLIEPLHPHIH